MSLFLFQNASSVFQTLFILLPTNLTLPHTQTHIHTQSLVVAWRCESPSSHSSPASRKQKLKGPTVCHRSATASRESCCYHFMHPSIHPSDHLLIILPLILPPIDHPSPLPPPPYHYPSYQLCNFPSPIPTSIHLFILTSINPSIHSSIRPSPNFPSINPSTYLSIYPYIHHLSLKHSICHLTVKASIHPFIPPSIYPSIFFFPSLHLPWPSCQECQGVCART